MPVDLGLHTVSTDQNPVIAYCYDMTHTQCSHQWSWLREKIVTPRTIRHTLMVRFLDHLRYQIRVKLLRYALHPSDLLQGQETHDVPVNLRNVFCEFD